MHLSDDLITLSKINKECNQLSLKCKCGSKEFYLFYGKQEKSLEKSIHEEKIEKFCSQATSIDGYIGKDGKHYIVRKFFGIPFGKMCIDLHDFTYEREIVKVKCVECSKEFVVFDNYEHGYASTVYEKDKNSQNILYKIILKNPSEIVIKVHYSLSSSEISETVDNESINYENLFTSLDIYSVRNGKKKKIFNFETD